MSKVQNLSVDDSTLRKNQERYEAIVKRNKMIMGYVFVVVAIIALVAVLTLPLYDFTLRPKKSNGNLDIQGKFTAITLITKYFANKLGGYSVLNTVSMLTTVILILSFAYMAVMAVLSVFCKSLVNGSGLKKFADYVFLEIVVVSQFIILIINMMCTKVFAYGKAENKLAFWAIFAASIVMTVCTISLSTEKHD